MCPGYNLGLRVVSSILGNLLHGFKWKLPDNMKNEEISMDEVFGLGTIRKYPLVAVMELTSTTTSSLLMRCQFDTMFFFCFCFVFFAFHVFILH